MKLDTLSAILTWATILLLHGGSTVLASPNGDNTSSRRIMNGQPANPADFPFLVKLHMDGSLCGGTIISNYWILTAAHCLFGANCPAIEIYPSTWQPGQPPQIHAARCVIHPQNEPGRYAFDLALINTVEDLVNGGLRAISLAPPGTNYPPGTPATIVGWGRTGDNSYPQTLLGGLTTVAPWQACNAVFKAGTKHCGGNPDCNIQDIPNRILCLQGNGPAAQSMCGGDSGGPVIINGDLAAVNTGSIYTDLRIPQSGCQSAAPTIHTNIVDNLPWLFSMVDPSVDTSGFPVAPENPDTLPLDA